MPVSYSTSKTPAAIIAGFALTAFLLILCVLFTSFPGWVNDWHFSAAFMFFLSRILFWISLAIIYIYVKKKEKQPFLLWKESAYGVGFYLASIFIILLIIIVGSAIIGLVIHFIGLSLRSNALKTVFGFNIPLKIFIVITAAIVEELIFRGYFLSRLQLFFKHKHWPLIISSIIFGLGHMRYGTVVNVLGPIFIGFVFAWHYQKYRNIKILIICHFMIDLTALMIPHK